MFASLLSSAEILNQKGFRANSQAGHGADLLSGSGGLRNVAGPYTGHDCVVKRLCGDLCEMSLVGLSSFPRGWVQIHIAQIRITTVI